MKQQHELYGVWATMRQRCNNPNAPNYKYYGGRGITVCKRWDNFKNFLADMGERPEGMTLDRIDNNKGYSPNNCRWATWQEQANNKSTYNMSERSNIIWRKENRKWVLKIRVKDSYIVLARFDTKKQMIEAKQLW